MPNIYAAITACMAEIDPISKAKHNQQQNFNYRGIDDVMNALQPIMVKNKIFAVPQVLEEKREERTTKNGGNLNYSILKVKYSFYADDGSSIDAIVIGEGMDSADKSSNKAMAAAFKYACFQTFCIPTEETHPDPDNDTPPPNAPEKVGETKLKVLNELIEKLGWSAERVLKNLNGNYHVQNLNELSVTQADKFLVYLNGKANASKV
jgi:hypothetical protein